MAKEICISTTPHETRLAILEDDQLAEVYYERENEYTLAGSIYKGRVTRVLPGMQSSFVDLGLERDAFLYVTDFLEDSEDSEEYDTGNAAGSTSGRRAAAPATPAEPVQGEERRSRRRGEGRARGEEQRTPAAQEWPAAASMRAAEPSEEQVSEKGDEDAPAGTRRWRGRRGRRRGGVRAGALGAVPPTATVEEAEEELSQPATAPFDLPERGAPGGIAAPFTVEPAEDEDTGEVTLRAAAAPPAVERKPSAAITLPGEALSKYGAAPAPAAQAQTRPATLARPVNYTPPKPATLVDLNVDLNAAGWDGGAVLPGETLGRYRKQEASAAPEQAAPPSTMIEENALSESMLPVESSPELAAEALPGAEHPERLVTRTEPLEPAAQTARSIEEATPALGGEGADLMADEPASVNAGAEPEAEYEPREGESASQAAPPYRSELRLSQLFGMGERPEPQAAAAQEPAEMEALPDRPEESTEAPPREAAESEPEMEDRLSRQIEGAGEPAPGDVFTQLVDQLHGFAPGSGLVEEEVIDEEEYEFDPVYAHKDEQDLEDLEEETLDGLQQAAIEAVEVPLPAAGAAAFALDEVEAEDEVEEGDEAEPAVGGAEPRRRDRNGDDRGRGGRAGGRRRGVGGRRQSAQTQDLPIISDLLKQGQEILVQIAKEPIAKKGARITSHIALPGRFLVFMPTVGHIGVSRKISSDEERQRLKRILLHERGEFQGGFIVRTAAESASEEELRADLRFLINLWTEIKNRADAAKAPALIYHDLNLVERILRDQVSSNFSTIWVDTEQEYERIVRFLNRFQPALVRRVKLYTKETPLFEHFGIQEEISKALKSKVWLRSGGSIVINQTEALVAIDINTGKYVGKTARLEDTIVKTNLDAIPEIVRQIRLRDLGGIIVIDFIDMDERRNRTRVLQALEEAMKVDRAPSKVLAFNDFGLVAITRKRVKQSLERTLSVQCEVCAGTGMVKSPVTVANEIYIELRKMQRHLEGRDVMLRVHPEVVKQLKSSGARWIGEYEEMVGKTVIIKSDPSLHPEQFDIQ